MGKSKSMELSEIERQEKELEERGFLADYSKHITKENITNILKKEMSNIHDYEAFKDVTDIGTDVENLVRKYMLECIKKIERL